MPRRTVCAGCATCGVVKKRRDRRRWSPAPGAGLDQADRFGHKKSAGSSAARKREIAGPGYKRQPEIAYPVFGLKNHIRIDREYGLLWRYRATHAAADE
jgi:hypothetical protein